MSGNISNSSLSIKFGDFFSYGGKISPLFAPYVFRHFDRNLEGLATKFEVIAPTNLSHILCLLFHLFVIS